MQHYFLDLLFFCVCYCYAFQTTLHSPSQVKNTEKQMHKYKAGCPNSPSRSTHPQTHSRHPTPTLKISLQEWSSEPPRPLIVSIFAAEMNWSIRLVVLPTGKRQKNHNNNNNLKYRRTDIQAVTLRPHHFRLPTPLGPTSRSKIVEPLFISGWQSLCL